VEVMTHEHNYECGLGPDHNHSEEKGCYPDNIVKYGDLIVEKATKENELIEKIDFSKYIHEVTELTEDQLKTLIVYSCFKTAITTWKNTELKDMSKYVVEQLEACNKNDSLSIDFINSIFNFNAVYRPLYDLLAMATEEVYMGKKKSSDYTDGIIDAIIALRRFETYSGFGDFNWEKEYNTAIG
jgi:hypothetical protein